MDYYKILKDICIELQNNIFDCAEGITVTKVAFSDPESSPFKIYIQQNEVLSAVKIYIDKHILFTKDLLSKVVDSLLDYIKVNCLELDFKTETEKQNFISHLKSLYE